MTSSGQRSATARGEADNRDGEGTAELELPPLAVQVSRALSAYALGEACVLRALFACKGLEWDSAAAEKMVATATAQITASVAARDDSSYTASLANHQSEVLNGPHARALRVKPHRATGWCSLPVEHSVWANCGQPRVFSRFVKTVVPPPLEQVPSLCLSPDD